MREFMRFESQDDSAMRNIHVQQGANGVTRPVFYSAARIRLASGIVATIVASTTFIGSGQELRAQTILPSQVTPPTFRPSGPTDGIYTREPDDLRPGPQLKPKKRRPDIPRPPEQRSKREGARDRQSQ